MSECVFGLVRPTRSPAAIIGRSDLERKWLACFVGLVVDMIIEDDAALFVAAMLWCTGGAPRSKDDTCSRLQRLGLVKPTRAKSVCVPNVLTPLGHAVREEIWRRAEAHGRANEVRK